MCTRNKDTGSRDLVLTEKIGPVFLIGINRPHKKNCVNPKTAACLVEAFKEFDTSNDSSVAVLHGKGGTFCAGFDLSELSTNENIEEEVVQNLKRGINFMGPSGMLLSKPVIAAVDGHAVAGGLELALLCDLRVVEDDAIMGVFCRRFGVPLLDGGTLRLPHLIGLSRALDLILTGRPVDAKEAHQIGLANRVVPHGKALENAISLATSIAAFPQECMKVDRMSTYQNSFRAKSLEEAVKLEFQNAQHVIQMESVEGARKFVSGVGKHGKF